MNVQAIYHLNVRTSSERLQLWKRMAPDSNTQTAQKTKNRGHGQEKWQRWIIKKKREHGVLEY